MRFPIGLITKSNLRRTRVRRAALGTNGSGGAVILELKAEGAAAPRFIAGNASWRPVAGAENASRANVALPRLEVQSVAEESAARATRNAGVLASVVSVQSSARQIAATEAYARGDTKTATALAERNMAELAEAKKLAPKAMAASLDSQSLSYGASLHAFKNTPSSSLEGKTAAKSSMVTESANSKRSAYASKPASK